MAITPVNGAATTSGVSVVTLSITYAPTAGNPIVLFLMASGAVTSIIAKDSANNNLTVGPFVQNTSTNVYSFYVLSSPSGVTGYTLSWTTTRTTRIVVEEYTGNNLGINATLPGNTASSSSTTASLTVTADEPNDFVVFGIMTAAALTLTAGNTRQNVSTSVFLVDNIPSPLLTDTASGTLTSASWAMVAIELRVASTLFTAPAITTEYHWGGGDW